MLKYTLSIALIWALESFFIVYECQLGKWAKGS